MAERSDGQHMARAWMEADLGNLLRTSIEDPQQLCALEEELVRYTHEIFEAGRTYEKGQNTRQEGSDYIRGLFDGIGILEEGGNL